jgi:mono/diheme cytochrome c family protein
MRGVAAVAAMALLVAACSLGGPREDATGEEIYAQLCARCHGADLDGGIGPGLGPGSTSEHESDEFLEFTIMNGRGRMPSFSSSLDESQLDRLVGYIREVEADE